MLKESSGKWAALVMFAKGPNIPMSLGIRLQENGGSWETEGGRKGEPMGNQ